MNTPSTATPSFPAYAPGAATTGMLAPISYQARVNAVLLATTRPHDRTPHGPLLSTAELAEMDTAFAMGLSAEGFAARLAARDRAGRAA